MVIALHQKCANAIQAGQEKHVLYVSENTTDDIVFGIG